MASTTALSGQTTWNALQPFTPAPAESRKAATSTDVRSGPEFLSPAASDKEIGVDLGEDSAAFAQKLFGHIMTMDRNTYLLFQKRFVQTLDDRRSDKQVIGSNAAGGSTDAVETPGLIDLLGFAISSGAIVQTVSQNQVTLAVNGDGFYRFLAGLDPSCPDSTLARTATANGVLDSCTPPSWAANFNASASFNASNGGSKVITGQSVADGSTQSALVNVTRKNFSSATVKYAFVNGKAPGSQKTFDKFNQFQNMFYRLTGPGGRLHAYIKGLLDRPTSRPVAAAGDCITLAAGAVQTIYTAWRCHTSRRLRTAAGVQKNNVLMEQIQTLTDQLREADPLFDVKVRELAQEHVKYLAAHAVTGADQPTGPMLTVDYTYSKPAVEPNLNTFTFVYSYTPTAKGSSLPATYTGNLGISLYTKEQPSDTRGNTTLLRNAQAAVQFDRGWAVNQATLQFSLSGYFQYQLKQGLIQIPAGSTVPGTSITLPSSASTLLAPKGLISLAEAKVTIKVPRMSAPIPLSFSWSNRTDLLKGNEVRGHIAFSFDSISMTRLGTSNP